MLNCPAKISFGLNVREPDKLVTRTTGEVLQGIASGQWQDAVARVRQLPADSPEQKAAKTALPFCTFAGVFSRRANSGLVQHSGQVGIDLDGLGDAGAVAVLQAAVADTFCLAAFRSTRGEGVRLIIRIPPCSPEHHVTAFEQVAGHVRKTYGHDADKSGKDVARASFVSFDRGLWFNAAADVLPIQLPGLIHSGIGRVTRCVSSGLYSGQLGVTCWTWYGRHLAATSPRADGAVKTHRSLLDLGKAVALHAERIGERLNDRHINAAFDAWLSEHARQGVRLRCSPDDYRRELVASVRGVEGKPWFRSAADKWLRWTRHKDFPKSGVPCERLLFAIRQHCADAGNTEFFLGVRDAGLITGGHFNTGARTLRKLVASGVLEKIGERRLPRDAQTYRLKS